MLQRISLAFEFSVPYGIPRHVAAPVALCAELCVAVRRSLLRARNFGSVGARTERKIRTQVKFVVHRVLRGLARKVRTIS